MGTRAARILLVSWIIAAAALLSPLVWGLLDVEAAPDSPGLQAARLLRLGGNSAWMALMATGMALVVAVPAALVAMRIEERRARATMLALAAVPLFVPPPAVAVAAIRLFGPAGLFTKLITGGEAVFPVAEQIAAATPQIASAPIYTLWGGAFTLAWTFHPLATFALCALLARADVSAEESAMLEASPVQVLGRITLRLAAGGVAAGAFLVFLMASTDFGVPESLRSLPVLVSEVYVQAGVYFDMRAALAAGLVLFALSAALVAAGGRMAGHDALSADSVAEPRRLAVRGPAMAFLRICGWIAAAGPAVTMIAALWLTATGPHGRWPVWQATWKTAHDELVFTTLLGTALLPAVAGAGIALGCALAVRKQQGPWRALIVLPLVLPGPLFGVAVQVLLRRPPGSLPFGLDDGLAALSQTHLPLLLVWAMRYAPVVALLVERAVRAIPAEQTDAARAEGAGAFAVFRTVQLPAIRHAALGGSLVAFALSLGEVGAAVLLLPPGTTTLGVRLLTLMHYAPTGQVSALCLFVLAPGLAAWGALVLAFRRRP